MHFKVGIFDLSFSESDIFNLNIHNCFLFYTTHQSILIHFTKQFSLQELYCRKTYFNRCNSNKKTKITYRPKEKSDVSMFPTSNQYGTQFLSSWPTRDTIFRIIKIILVDFNKFDLSNLESESQKHKTTIFSKNFVLTLLHRMSYLSFFMNKIVSKISWSFLWRCFDKVSIRPKIFNIKCK